MKLNFFADHCISNFIIRSLKNSGHEVFLLKEHIPKDSDDPVVILKAKELNAILLTLNGDFTDIITYPPEEYNGIIALQVRNHPEDIPHIVKKLIDYLSSNSDMNHYRGKLFVVKSHTIKVRA